METIRLDDDGDTQFMRQIRTALKTFGRIRNPATKRLKYGEGLA
jgi:hypothetical protein